MAIAPGLPTQPTGIQNQITAAFKQQFHDTFEIACQQKQSALESLVTSRGQISGSSFTINDMGRVEMEQRKFTDRFTTTEFKLPQAGTRLALMEDYDLFIPIEPFDLPKLSASPDAPYMQLMVAAANRAKDNLIFRQLFADIQRKVETPDQIVTTPGALPAANKGGYTNQSFDASQQILASGTGYVAPTTGASPTAGAAGLLNKESLIKMRALFMKNYADNEEIYITYNSAMLQTILANTELTSADYMAVQMLQAGNVAGKWLGMNWINYEAMPEVGTDGSARGTGAFKAAVFTRTALHFGTGINFSTDVQTRADLRNIKQLSAQMSFGAGRANELKVASMIFKY